MEYASSYMIRIAGASQRQLQLWDEQNLVSLRHAGHHRLYTSDEVIEVAIVAELRRKGIRLQKVRLILNHPRRNLGKRLSDTLANDPEVYLVTDCQRHHHLERRRNGIIERLKNSSGEGFCSRSVIRPDSSTRRTKKWAGDGVRARDRPLLS
jgi:DNA-binding transcriptional MerR regulator